MVDGDVVIDGDLGVAGVDGDLGVTGLDEGVDVDGGLAAVVENTGTVDDGVG